MKRAWSAPFYGLQHLQGIRSGYQVSVQQRGDWSEARIWSWGTGTSQTLAERDFEGEDAQARARSWAQNRAHGFGLFK